MIQDTRYANHPRHPLRDSSDFVDTETRVRSGCTTPARLRIAEGAEGGVVDDS